MKKISNTRKIVSVAVVFLIYFLAWFAEKSLGTNSMLITVLKKGAVYALIAASMNLLNGFTGLFSLGQAGFMLVGAYTYAVFTIPLNRHAAVYQYYNGGIIQFQLPMLVALLLAGVMLLAALCTAGAETKRRMESAADADV
jgi:branched-chain amino acid transport system permease protein